MQHSSPQQVQAQKPEMWYIDLAKSKVILAFSKSCELVIFFGCLWLTLVTVVPSAEGWLWGNVNTFFLASMGFAVDAAMPESWLHVVGQYIDKKHTQLKWSVSLAIAMFLLVVANILYLKLAGSEQARDGLTWLVDTLLIMRMVIGICYITVRECQNFIDRQTANQHQVIPVVDIQSHLDAFTETMNRRFSEMKSESESRLQMTETRLSETLHCLMSESEARFTETLRTFTETPDTTFSESLSETFTESLQEVVRAQMEMELRPVYDAIQGHASILEALSALPSQQAQLSVIVREVKATVERIPTFTESPTGFTERPKLLSLKAGVKVSEVKPPVSVKASESFTEASLKETSESSFDKKAFVQTCLSENTAITIAEIQRRAEAIGQSVSTGYISNIRKALGEEQSA